MREISMDLPRSHLRVRGLEWRPNAAKKVVALHGWLDNAASFMPLAPLLTDTHLIALDWPGHGHSDHIPEGMTYHFTDYLTYLHEFLDAWGDGPITLLGHSLGGAVGTLFAGAFPEKIERLILVEGFGPIPSKDDEARRRLREHVERRLQLNEKEMPVYTKIEKAVRARLMATPMEEGSARLIVERNLEAIPVGWTWRTDQRLTLPSPQRFAETQVTNILQHITCPTLLITAQDGMLHSGGVFPVTPRLRAVKNLQHHTLPGNHHLHMDTPAPVAALINDFLREKQNG